MGINLGSEKLSTYLSKIWGSSRPVIKLDFRCKMRSRSELYHSLEGSVCHTAIENVHICTASKTIQSFCIACKAIKCMEMAALFNCSK